MNVVIDVEANSLVKPTKVWVIVCKNIATNDVKIFRNPTDDRSSCDEFLAYANTVTTWIGHNILGYDFPVLNSLLGYDITAIANRCIDTLIISKLVDYSRKEGHSLESYGEEFGLLKSKFSNFSKYSIELEERCIQDVHINHRVFLKYRTICDDPDWRKSILLEHNFQVLVNELHTNGFSFNTRAADNLLKKVTEELRLLDVEILKSFPPKEVLIREFTPKLTKHGTISKSSVPRNLVSNIHEYEAGKTYRHTKAVEFNPASHKQIIDVLTEAGWRPLDKTKTHVDSERELNRLKYNRKRSEELDYKFNLCHTKLKTLGKYGYKINETNLATLPQSAPTPARTLAQRILLEARRRTLTEWLNLVQDDGRIHGKFYGIGAWTHRMAHQQPNTANIPTEFKLDGSPKLLGKEMRSLWQAPRKRLLVGVDAEGIQLRIFAHYIDDKEFTQALVSGKKSDKSDPHSLNQSILGNVCKSRAASKRFIFAYLLGSGLGKLAEILECSREDAEEALNRLLKRYSGLDYLKREVIPIDAQRGWFTGLDGRKVSIIGDTVSERKHLCMSGYLQNGEAVVMKKAAVHWHRQLSAAEELMSKWLFVNMVHDEWQTEVPNNMDVAKKIANIQSDSLRIVGEELKLKCPLAGSYWNEDNKDYTIGVNWFQTH